MDELWLVVLACGGFLAPIGMVVYGCGTVRARNSAGAVARHLANFCVVTLAVWAAGMAILWQTNNRFFGVDPALLFGNGRASSSHALPFIVLTLLSTGIVVNAVAERARFAVVMTVSVVMAVLVVPALASLAWYGALFAQAYTDLGGVSAVHLTGGLAAAVTVAFVGPRRGKYNRDGSSNAIPGHNVPVMMVGALFMIVGWVPMLYAVAVARDLAPSAVAVKVLVAGAAGGLMALWYGRFRYGKVDVLLMTAGLLGGLVAISGGAHVVHPGFALLIGAVAGVVVPLAAVQLDLRFKWDDPANGIAIHAVGGILGAIAAALLGPSPMSVGVQLLGLAVIGASTVAAIGLILWVLRRIIPLRSTEADEYDGLDLAEHDINAYPDFSQTMIKSYHLREA